jgi:hypothetical protein
MNMQLTQTLLEAFSFILIPAALALAFWKGRE